MIDYGIVFVVVVLVQTIDLSFLIIVSLLFLVSCCIMKRHTVVGALWIATLTLSLSVKGWWQSLSDSLSLQVSLSPQQKMVARTLFANPFIRWDIRTLIDTKGQAPVHWSTEYYALFLLHTHVIVEVRIIVCKGDVLAVIVSPVDKNAVVSDHCPDLIRDANKFRFLWQFLDPYPRIPWGEQVVLPVNEIPQT